MKIAILADIHANLAALHAVAEDIEAWNPDRVIVAGDTINRGPQSAECLAFVRAMARRRGWQLMQGNHEDYLVKIAENRKRPDFPTGGPRYEVLRSIDWTYQQMGGDVAGLDDLPDRLDLDFGSAGTLSVRHASIRHNRDGILNRHSDDELRERIVVEATVFCTAHTHMPFVRSVGPTLLVNVGSVGLPFDGDTRASYARLSLEHQGWRAEIVRLPYDLDAALHAFVSSGMYEGVGDVGPLMFRELQTGNSLMFDFINEFHSSILAGELSIGAAVRRFMDRL